MSEVVLRLQTIYESVETKPIERKKSSASAMVGDEQLTDKAYAFALRVGGTEASAKVEELRDKVEALLGKYAVATVTGVYNSARLYRFLLGNGMDVQDAKSAVVLNNNGRAMLEMDAKRMAICELYNFVSQLSFAPPVSITLTGACIQTDSWIWHGLWDTPASRRVSKVHSEQPLCRQG